MLSVLETFSYHVHLHRHQIAKRISCADPVIKFVNPFSPRLEPLQ